MKSMILSLLFAAASLAAADPKIYTPAFTEVGGDPVPPDTRFTAYQTEKPLPKGFPETGFSVVWNASLFSIVVELAEPDTPEPDNIIELFFTGFPQTPAWCYYQYYGSADKKEDIAFYLRGRPSSAYHAPRGVVTRSLTPATAGKPARRILRFTFPWSDFQYQLPFDGHRDWRFNLVRWRGNTGAAWNGLLHEPATYGILRWPEFPESVRRDILRSLIRYNLETPLPFDSDSVSEESFNTAVAGIQKECNVIREKATNSASTDELAALFARSRDIRNLRIPVASSYLAAPSAKTPAQPGWTVYENRSMDEKTVRNEVKKPFEWNALPGAELVYEYTLPHDLSGNLVVTDCAAGNTASQYRTTLTVNGKKPFVFDTTVSAKNIRVDADLKKGDVIRLSFAPRGETKKFSALFYLTEFQNGALPGAAFNVLRPAAESATLHRNHADGGMNGEQLSRHEAHQRDMLRNKPRVVFLGDSITDGFRGEAWKTLARFRPCNMGISGDVTQNLLWRVRNSVLDRVHPELAVIMIGTNNGAYTPEEIASGIRLILREIQRKSPETNILLLGIFPRGNGIPKIPGRIEKTNAIIAGFADGKSVFYKDISSIWVDANGKLRTELMPDRLHPNQAGYYEWIKAITPDLERFLPDAKESK